MAIYRLEEVLTRISKNDGGIVLSHAKITHRCVCVSVSVVLKVGIFKKNP